MRTYEEPPIPLLVDAIYSCCNWIGRVDCARSLGGDHAHSKTLYLLESEGSTFALGEGFKFEAYKGWPYSPRFYDDLELLENLDYISRSVKVESSKLQVKARAPQLKPLTQRKLKWT